MTELLKILEYCGLYSKLMTPINCWMYITGPYVHCNSERSL